MSLIALVEEDVPFGSPLLWNIVDEDGKVLFPHGHVIDNKPLLSHLLKRGLFRSAPQAERETLAAAAALIQTFCAEER